MAPRAVMVEVRMDSMFAGTTSTWVRRAENAYADLLADPALDGQEPTAASPGSAPLGNRSRPGNGPGDGPGDRPGDGPGEDPAGEGRQGPPPRGWAPRSKPTTLVLVRHGVTDHTVSKLFSGGLASSNPPLNDEGRRQARATGEWLAPRAGTFDALVTSPVRRTHETAEIIGGFIEREIEFEHGIAEMEFGSWDGLSFTEVHERYPDEMSAWLGDLESAPHGGESFRSVEKRVLEGRDRIVTAYGGRTVVAVSHVTPIKTLVADALGAPLEAVYRMELAPASVTVISYFLGGPEADLPMANLRLYNARPTDILD